MTADDWVKIIGAGAAGTAAVLGAIGLLWAQIGKTHRLVNSRMTELLDITRKASRAEGRLDSVEPGSRPAAK